jgi:uncharacterized membrane protein YcaP (DUF421 family)
MFVLQLPLLEKIVRPMIVYLVLIVFLRLFGKRELAQLNPFDLVVLLSLSNTVQNAIIGDDNSVSGGVIGAFSLLAINWLLTRVLYRAPKLTAALQGTSTRLISNGKVDAEALRSEALSEMELLSVLHRQGFDSFSEVECCVLEPNGTFFVEARKPSPEDVQIASLLAAVERLSTELRALRTELQGSGGAARIDG